MRFEQNAIAIFALLVASTVGFPSLGMAVVNGASAPTTRVYAQASTVPNPKSVDDATLQRAAAAYVKVRDISVRTEQAMNSTDDTAKRQQLMTESESAKVAAVKQEGMEPQQYNNVILLVKGDTSLQQKFLSYVQQLRHAS
jgi:apolipoprotein N-acyltransferase